MKRHTTRLALNRDTVRVLTGLDLDVVASGKPLPPGSIRTDCDSYCCPPPPPV